MSSPDPTRRPLLTEGPSAGGDELDDLFDYDVDDPFNDDLQVPATKKRDFARDTEKGKTGAGLGIDEEYSDAAKLLAFYQLWLDDLFPKARFLDALAMVEKMGHKRQLQVARMEWINEGKPKSADEDLYSEPTLPPRENEDTAEKVPRIASIFDRSMTQRPKTPEVNDQDLEDLYDATPRPAHRKPAEKPAEDSQRGSIFGGGSTFGEAITTDDGPPEDDLDILLAEEEVLQTVTQPTQPSAASKPTQEDNFDDDMEAMAEMDDMW
ncbi:hypothetical protein B7494_g5048 [Chlorociboria aeruginascens]|nr:hypothetical protein B7494_g5048 [Chlorociboria aeruginascens]